MQQLDRMTIPSAENFLVDTHSVGRVHHEGPPRSLETPEQLLPCCRSLVETLPEDEEAVVSGQQARRPVAWLLLRPARTSSQQRQPLRALALPISCDAALPDFIVKADVFEKGMRRHWHRQDRFRMFFASSYTNKTG